MKNNSLESFSDVLQNIDYTVGMTDDNLGYPETKKQNTNTRKANPIISFISKHPWFCLGATIYVGLLILCSIKGNFDFEGILTFALFSLFLVSLAIVCLYLMFSNDINNLGEFRERSFLFPSIVTITSIIYLFSFYFDIKDESQKRRQDKELEELQSQTESVSNYNYYETIFVPLEDCFSDNGKNAYYPVYTTTTGEKYH